MLLIDRRVGSKELAAYLPDGSYLITDLDSGDAAFLGYGPDGPLTYPVGIERKAFYDLLECFLDGRLNSQIQVMTELYHRIYLIVEGRPRLRDGKILVPRRKNGKTEWRESRITYAMLDNYLNTLTDERRVQVKRSFNLEESAWQVMDIYNHCSTEKHSSHLKLDTSWEVQPFMPPSFKKRVAAQLDHIGEKKADDVANHFRSVTDMGNAGEHEWLQIAGIGKTIAKSVMAQFRNQKS